MVNKISIATKMGWISVFEDNGKIFQIKFGKIKKQSKSEVLEKFKKKIIEVWTNVATNTFLSTSLVCSLI